MKPVIAITLGDLGGIGPEVTFKALQTFYGQFRPLILGSASVLPHISDWISPWKIITLHHLPRSKTEVGDEKTITFCDVFSVGEPALGKPSASNGKTAQAFLEAAVSLAQNGIVDALCTAPISKTSMALAGCRFLDHTTFLTDATQSPATSMAFYTPTLKTVLATVHVPLKQALADICPSLLDKTLANALRFATLLGLAHPRIALAGLNPHAGEGGLYGTEEIETLIPFIKANQSEKMTLSGPYPPDTLYHRAHKGEFDIVLSLYHDQGLIPIKLIAFDDAVNVTLGLPFLRTSPDHGTAFDLVGQNKANPASMQAALQFLLDSV
ncbi:MAG: 4-hydroxythreonine-4-phosphate dehydrogenase PdxA [Candidatus Margulisiibacteriota bacterium]